MTDDPPTDDTRTERLRALLAADRDLFHPPPGLVVRTVGRLASVLVAEGRFDPATGRFRDPPVAAVAKPRRPVADSPVFPSWARADLLVVAALLLLAVALGVPLVQKVRRQADAISCREQLRGLYAGLKGYADANEGRLPQVGTASLPTAGGFVAELVRSGHADPSRAVGCGRPEGDPDPGYAYTLGYVNRGGWLSGVRLPDVADTTPVAADLPRYGGEAVTGRHGGWNVLMAGGSVRFATTVHVGRDGDDIFRNGEGWHRAGLHADDTSLGRPFDRP
jgi:prepilin-type processing-associated H-X9-DG protein